MAWVPPYNVGAGQTGEPNVQFQLSDFAQLGRGRQHGYEFDWQYHQADGEDILEAVYTWRNWQQEYWMQDLFEKVAEGWDDGLSLTDAEDVKLFLSVVVLAGPEKFAQTSWQLTKLYGVNIAPKGIGGKGNEWLQAIGEKVGANIADNLGPKVLWHKVTKVVDKINEGKFRKGPWDPKHTTVARSSEAVAKYKNSQTWSARMKTPEINMDLPDYEPDVDRLKRNVYEFFTGTRYLESHELEEMEGANMPYNRRTGQWYPARRRGGYGYRRGYRRYGSGTGYGRYRNRRSYRRW